MHRIRIRKARSCRIGHACLLHLKIICCSLSAPLTYTCHFPYIWHCSFPFSVTAFFVVLTDTEKGGSGPLFSGVGTVKIDYEDRKKCSKNVNGYGWGDLCDHRGAVSSSQVSPIYIVRGLSPTTEAYRYILDINLFYPLFINTATERRCIVFLTDLCARKGRSAHTPKLRISAFLY